MVRSLDIALKHLCILGSTGSIGTSALSIVERYPERFAIASLAAGRNLDLAFSQCKQWRPQLISVATEELAAELSSRLKAAGLRAETDLRNEKVGYKVREHSLAKVPVIAVVGRREADEGKVAIRRLGSQAQTVVTLEEAVRMLADEATPPDLR